jgi:small subunit ribosomal protein S9
MIMVKKEEKKKEKKAVKKKAAPAKEAPKAEKEAPKEKAKEEKPKKEEKAEAKEAPKKEEKPKKTVKKKTRKKAKKPVKSVVARGKRKECVARATIREGKGMVRMNSQSVATLNNRYVQEIITEPLSYIGAEAEKIDISVNVRGGGAMGQAQAARVAIANALMLYFKDMKLREKFISIDRSLIVEDTRRVETKKYRGPKARARYQKSYR